MQKFIVALFSFVVLTSCTQKKEISKDTLEITGTVKGLKKGTLYLQKIEDTTLVMLDTIALNGSSTFESSVKLDSPEMLYLYLDRGASNSKDNRLLFFAEPGKINIDTDLDFFLSSAKITGSKNQELYEQYKKIISQFNEQQLELLKAQIMASKGNKNYSEEDNLKKQDALLKRRYLYAANFALTNADHEVAPYIALTDIHDINPKFLDTIQKSMTPQVSKSKYGKRLNDYIKELKTSTAN